MEMKIVKRISLFTVLVVLFAGSLQFIVSDLQARGGRGGGGHHGGGHHGHGHHGHHGGGRHGHGHHGHHGGYGHRGYGYGGGYWGANGAWIAPAVVGGVALGAAASSSGTTVIEDGGYQGDDAYPTCGQYQYFDPATGQCEDVSREKAISVREEDVY